jgi:signal transduction histidine kinase
MAEREKQLNEVLAHEVRNPLASAIAAMTLVSSKAIDPQVVPLVEHRTSFQNDFRVMENSLQFINELLRNMLDVHRTNDKAMKLKEGPTDILKDVLEPVASIICMRGTKASVETMCEPTQLIVHVDKLRVQQICLNLAANATKFVEKGYIRLCAHVEQQTHGESSSSSATAQRRDNVVISISDSGPGIPVNKRSQLFVRFQESLDILNQGTGIGLNVCKNLSDLMGADLYLDEDFDSGVTGCVGTRFVLRLNRPPIDLENEKQSSRSFTVTSGLLMELPHGDTTGSSNGAAGKTSSESIERHLPPKMSILFVDDEYVINWILLLHSCSSIFTHKLIFVCFDWFHI